MASTNNFFSPVVVIVQPDHAPDSKPLNAEQQHQQHQQHHDKMDGPIASPQQKLKVLVVYAHPEPQSFCGALKTTTVEKFTALGHEVKVSDLYALKFNPVLDRSDFAGELVDSSYFKPQREQGAAATNHTFAPDVAQELEKLHWCDVLVFAFPLYWFSVPAILKGWVDRVIVFGDVYGSGKWFDNGTQKGKRAFCIFTTGGPSPAYTPRGRMGDLSEILFHVHHGVFAFCGFSALPPFVAYGAAHSEEIRPKYLKDLSEYLERVSKNEVEELKFHSLADYEGMVLKEGVPTKL